jgi:hypothetical protein
MSEFSYGGLTFVRSNLTILTAALISGWAVLLAGCSGNVSPGASGVPQDLLRSALSIPAAHLPKATLKSVAVSDNGNGSHMSSVAILNHSYQLVQSISGLTFPRGASYDFSGNLYVANFGSASVLEYAPGSSSPSFTYTTGLVRPDDVKTDKAGDVYVADENDGGTGVGSVFEFSQGSNTVLNRCSNGMNYEGIAIDKQGNVFASGRAPNYGSGVLLEYKGGLTGCTPTTLGVTLASGGGLLVDKHGNLIACDYNAHDVVIIPPPYTSVSSTITGFENPTYAALDMKENLLFVADPNSFNVQVLKYPSGTYVTMLDSSNGLYTPEGVAVYKTVKW